MCSLGEGARMTMSIVHQHVVPQYQYEAHPVHFRRRTLVPVAAADSDSSKWQPSHRRPFSEGSNMLVKDSTEIMVVPAEWEMVDTA